MRGVPIFGSVIQSSRLCWRCVFSDFALLLHTSRVCPNDLSPPNLEWFGALVSIRGVDYCDLCNAGSDRENCIFVAAKRTTKLVRFYFHEVV